MCGIAGVINRGDRFAPEDLSILARKMADTIAHRGPDDAGVWLSPDGRTALSHRRLSIIDTSSGGHQPMASQDEQRHIVFNGEIYNFLELRAELEATGVAFRSRSDTEVLLELIGQRGPHALLDVDGMYAIALHDAGDGSIFLAIDRFGEKPLYYTEVDGLFAFASELNALTLIPGFDARIDAGVIAKYLAFQYIPAPQTIYRSVQKLTPGTSLHLPRSGVPHIERTYRFQPNGPAHNHRTLSEAGDELEALLIHSVRTRLISDVPIGAFLSGGVDSSTVVAIAAKVMNASVKTFTIGFAGHSESEHLEADEIARHLRTDHHERLLHPDGMALCAKIGSVLDEPNGDTSCLPTYLLSAFAREKVTVAISGDGGDELFGGYGRYLATIDEQERKAAGGMEWWSPAAAYWSSRLLVFPDSEIEALAGAVPEALAIDLAGLRSSINNDARPIIHRMREVDAGHYMPGAVLAKVDRMSMQLSLEVRAPLLGKEIAEFAVGLSADECVMKGQGKIVLKEVARRYLPESWMRRPKRGFGLPMGLWGAPILMPAARSLLLGNECRLAQWIPRSRLVAYLDRCEKEFNAYRLWSLLILEHWLRTHLHNVGESFGNLDLLVQPKPVSSIQQFVGRARRALFGTAGNATNSLSRGGMPSL